MFGVVQSSGAVTVYPFKTAIIAAEYRGSVARVSNLGKSFVSSTIVTSFLASKNFIVVGCATC